MSSFSDVWTGAKQVLEGNWREGRTDGGLVFGYTCPDSAKYPDQFFWDSCFHALAWSRLDPRRAMQEMKSCGAAARSSISARSIGPSVEAKPGAVSRSRNSAMAAWCSGLA